MVFVNLHRLEPFQEHFASSHDVWRLEMNLDGVDIWPWVLDARFVLLLGLRVSSRCSWPVA
jgi:hypothetical protein